MHIRIYGETFSVVIECEKLTVDKMNEGLLFILCLDLRVLSALPLGYMLHVHDHYFKLLLQNRLANHNQFAYYSPIVAGK